MEWVFFFFPSLQATLEICFITVICYIVQFLITTAIGEKGCMGWIAPTHLVLHDQTSPEKGLLWAVVSDSYCGQWWASLTVSAASSGKLVLTVSSGKPVWLRAVASQSDCKQWWASLTVNSDEPVLLWAVVSQSDWAVMSQPNWFWLQQLGWCCESRFHHNHHDVLNEKDSEDCMCEKKAMERKACLKRKGSEI